MMSRRTHTPRDRLYGLETRQKFAGATTQGWKAYNITSDQQFGIGGWSDADLATYLSTGFAEGHGTAPGNMAEAVEHSLRYLSAADIQAMVAYLKSTPPRQTDADSRVNPSPPALRGSTDQVPAEGERPSLGLRVFQSACASCHGWNGEGLQHPQAAPRGSHSVNDPKAANLLRVVLNGAHLETPDEGEAFMPAFARAWSDVEIAAVANYVVAHFGGKQPGVTPMDVAVARELP